ncbi:MAG: (4Fe-4S)-binding protein, partial [Desulfovibrio sp.]|nr:(4Fe-4S)-binding protein [Desulfovibrio sp.]
CHGCGGCFAVCEANALVPSNRLLGRIYEGHCLERQAYFLGGETRIGEVMTPPLLRAMLDVLKKVPKECDVLLDCPPGVSCPVVTVARQVDGIVLVVDPTPFGFSDFTLASEGMRKLGKRMGCVINRAYMPGNERGEEKVLAFCAQEGLPVFGMIPFSKEAALRTSEGKLLVDQESFRGLFTDVAKGMIEYFSEVGRG